MKLKKFIAAVLALIPALSGCAAPKTRFYPEFSEVSAPEGERFKYVYKSGSMSEHIAVSESGRVVSTVLDMSGPGLSCRFLELLPDGSSEELAKCASYPDSIAFMGDDLYMAETWGSTTVVSKYDLESGEKERYAEMPIKYCFQLFGNRNELFIYGDDPKKKDLTCGYEYFTNLGKSVYRIADGQAEEIAVDFPTAVCAKQDGGAIIAGCDDDGYFLVEYKDGQFGRRVSTTEGGVNHYISGLADVDGTHIVMSCATTVNDYMLCTTTLDNFFSFAELVPDVMIYDRIFSADGYVYYCPIVLKKTDEEIEAAKKDPVVTIERIRFADFFRDSEPLTMIRSYRTGGTPFNCGYTINALDISNDETSLKILSQDKDYDISYINNSSFIAYSIRKQGCFCALNNVKGVKEYLDKCFPYLKDAFTDENGDIWALPVSVKNDIVFSTEYDNIAQMELPEYIDFIDGFTDEEYAGMMNDTFGMTLAVLSDYLSNHGTFDTPEFRACAEKLKNASGRLNLGKSGGTISVNLNEKKQPLLTFEADMILKNLSDVEFNVSGFPGIGTKNVVCPEVSFICVNPYSAHLNEALNYVAKVAEFLQTQPDTFLFAPEYGKYTDSAAVKRILELYEDAEMTFQFPSEIYWDDFEAYLQGSRTLDKFVKEADRKMKVYLNE